MEQKALLERHWYYKIEISPDRYTPGREHGNLALTRCLLRNLDIQGARCLDIGTQEAVMPILLKKAGAREVVAYDRFDWSGKIQFLQEIYDVNFKYHPGLQLMDLPDRLGEGENRSFDLVVFSGILYHMMNPMGLLALSRGLCKSGGYFLLETVAKNDPEAKLIFNTAGKVYGDSSNYFIPTTSWLDYILRMLGLRPVQAVYMGKRSGNVRIALLCHSENKACPLDENDKWASAPFHRNIFRDESFFDMKSLGQSGVSKLKLASDHEHIALQNRSVFDAVNIMKPYQSKEEERILSLNGVL